MSEEILINVTPQETRVAVVENGMLQEAHIERTQKRGLVGNIFKGRVARVLPGMQAAFIDIGLARTAFLHTSDIACHEAGANGESEGSDTEQRPIESILTEGGELLAQVIKDPIGGKGARLTTRLAIPSRYIVFMPDHPAIGISQRIEDPAERERMRAILLDCQAGAEPAAGDGADTRPPDAGRGADGLRQGGFIVRTAAENIAAVDIARDIEFLRRLWASILARAEHTPAPGVVYEDLPLVMRALRDLVHPGIAKVRIDSRETHDRALAFCRHFIPEFPGHIEYYTGPHPLLDLYAIEDDIQRGLERRTPLKSGGHLIIDQTEAMTTIDVNTGAFVGHRNQEETFYKTNLEAAHSIARQLRLRNLGGIIIVDFIDMRDPEHGQQVLRALKKHVAKDHARTSLSELTSLGLVQLTRKRSRESLEQVLCEACPVCHGRGKIKSAETVCYEIFREILREVRQFEADKLLVVASQGVVERLHEDESDNVAALEAFIDRPIAFQVEALYNQEQYDIVLL